MVTMTRYRTVLLFGGPGSGKGTQGCMLGGMPNFVHVSSGDIFRALSPQSSMGKEFRSYSSKGLLVPDELTIRVWLRHMMGMENLEQFIPEYHILVSDGLPRTVGQVDLLAQHLEVIKILYFSMEENRLVERLKGRALKENRPDDAHEGVIRKRIQVYEESTLPVLLKYPQQLVSRINADQHPLAVARDMCAALVDSTPGAI
ncbi:MAG: adenylate kinase [Phycisphaerae bacterium]|nr:adenylate kinase [Phycisphaerae bacterium]